MLSFLSLLAALCRAHKVYSVCGSLASVARLLPGAFVRHDAPGVLALAGALAAAARLRLRGLRLALLALIVALSVLDHASWWIMGAAMPWELLFLVLGDLPLMLTNLHFLRRPQPGALQVQPGAAVAAATALGVAIAARGRVRALARKALRGARAWRRVAAWPLLVVLVGVALAALLRQQQQHPGAQRVCHAADERANAELPNSVVRLLSALPTALRALRQGGGGGGAAEGAAATAAAAAATTTAAAGGFDAAAAAAAAAAFNRVLLDVSTQPLRRGASAPPSRNVVLVFMESVRASATTLHTPALHSTPFLAAAAAAARAPSEASGGSGDGTIVDSMTVPIANTMKSLWAMMSGTPPYAGVEWREYESARALPAALPALLEAAGVDTAFVTSGKQGLHKRLGFGTIVDGADLEAEHAAHNRSFGEANWLGLDERAMLQPLRRMLERRREEAVGAGMLLPPPLFMVLATVVGHAPYSLPHSCRPAGLLARAAASSGGFAYRGSVGAATFDRYLDAVACTDGFARELVATFGAAGEREGTTFLFVGDHGEAFGEHPGSKFHGNALFQEQVHVPLLLLGPGARTLPPRLGGAWSTLDLKPTILSMLGFAPQLAAVGAEAAALVANHTGRSMLEAPPSHSRAIHLSCLFEHACLGMRRENLKWMYTIPTKRLQAFNLSADPGEQHDLLSDDDGAAAAAGISDAETQQVVDGMQHWLAMTRARFPDATKLQSEFLSDAAFDSSIVAKASALLVAARWLVHVVSGPLGGVVVPRAEIAAKTILCVDDLVRRRRLSLANFGPDAARWVGSDLSGPDAAALATEALQAPAFVVNGKVLIAPLGEALAITSLFFKSKGSRLAWDGGAGWKAAARDGAADASARGALPIVSPFELLLQAAEAGDEASDQGYVQLSAQLPCFSLEMPQLRMSLCDWDGVGWAAEHARKGVPMPHGLWRFERGGDLGHDSSPAHIRLAAEGKTTGLGASAAASSRGTVATLAGGAWMHAVLEGVSWQAVTLAAWVLPGAPPAGPVLSFYGAETHIGSGGSALKLDLLSLLADEPATDLDAARWRHVACTFSVSAHICYVDGEVVGASRPAASIVVALKSAALASSPAHLYVGVAGPSQSAAEQSPTFSGSLDDVAVFSFELMAVQIRGLMHGLLPASLDSSTRIVVEAARAHTCIDIEAGARYNGALLVVWECHLGWNQFWAFSRERIINPETQKCMTPEFSTRTGATELVLDDCNDNISTQRFVLDKEAHSIRHVQTGHCITIGGPSIGDGAPVVLEPCAAAKPNQRLSTE
jgi:hypothetical protein